MSERLRSDRSIPAYVVMATCVLALLHYGQPVLEPLALAVVLSLALEPLIRLITRLGLGRKVATMVSVLLVGVAIVLVSWVLAIQFVAVAADLPQYRDAIRAKVEQVREDVVRPLERLQGELVPALAPPMASSMVPHARVPTAKARILTAGNTPVPVEIRAPRASAEETVTHLLSLVSGPLGEAGIVLVLLVFILIEHESLGDRFARLVGDAELGRGMQALRDATHGVSRFFFSQLLVNTTFGLVVSAGLWLLGIPHSALWGALSAVLRFVPYIGILGAGAAIATFVAAIDPGWTLLLSFLALFLSLELLVSNVVEPHLYGHSSGVTPLSVILSALFWGALWGPVGLLLSTPLMLCLVVMGKHVRMLRFITLMFGDNPGLTAGQRFYQRALGNNPEPIIADARPQIRQRGFAWYCDYVLLPGLALAIADYQAGRIDNEQQASVRNVIAHVAEALTAMRHSVSRRRQRRHTSLLDADVGAHLRQMREAKLGRWQGSLDVPAGSIVLCCGLNIDVSELLTELLVRALRDRDVDARSMPLSALQDTRLLDNAHLISTIFLVDSETRSLDEWQQAIAAIRTSLPNAAVVALRVTMRRTAVKNLTNPPAADLVLRTFSEAAAFSAAKPTPA